MKVRRSLAALLVLVLLLGVLAPTALADEIPGLAVEVKLAGEATSMAYGDTAQAVASSTVAEGTQVTYTYAIAEGSAVAEVDEDGVITAIGTGPFTLKVTATAEDYDKTEAYAEGVTVVQRNATIVAQDQTIEEGGTISQDVNYAIAYNLALGDQLVSVELQQDASAQTITPSNAVVKNAAGVDVSQYYTFVYQPGNYTVSTPPQETFAITDKPTGTVFYGDVFWLDTANDDGETVYWSANGVAKVTDSGKVYITGVGDFSVTATKGSAPDAAKDTYYGEAKKAKLIVTADDKRVYCGDRAPEYTVTITGYKGWDDFHVLKGTLLFNCSYTRHSKPGNYTIEPHGTLEADNYEIVYRNGTLKAVVWEYYDIEVVKTGDGTVKVDRSYAAPGKTVTVTVTPDWGGELRSLTVTDSRGYDVKLTYNRYQDVYTFEMPYRNVTVKAVFAETDLPFVDVSDWDWYSGGIRYVYENGLMNGTSSWYFRPTANTTRAMVATVLYRLEGSPRVSGGSGFTDVKSGSWYDDAVTWASRYGIIKGYGDDTFGPNDSVTREQMAAMLYRYADYCRCDMTAGRTIDLSQYRDHGDVSTYAIPALRWAIGEEIITGRTGRFLAPDGTASRAEVAVMVARFAEDVIG